MNLCLSGIILQGPSDGRFSLHNDDKPNGSNLFASYCIRLQDLHQGYRHVPLVDLQGEKYIYSTLFVKVNWSFQEISCIERSPTTPAKLEKKSKTKVRLMKMDEASRSGTSIDSSTSSTYSAPPELETVRMERGNSNTSVVELASIHEVNEGKEK